MKLAELSHCAKRIAFALIPVAALCTTRLAFGQAEETGDRPLSANVYAGGAYVTPDDLSPKDYGFVAGASVTRNMRPFQPALDLRLGYATGPHINESYFLANLKAGKALGPSHRIRPYGMAGIGYGKVKFAGGYVDNSVICGAGAGLDYSVTPRFAAKADWDYQFWNLGNSTHGLTPAVITVGASYRIRVGR